MRTRVVLLASVTSLALFTLAACSGDTDGKSDAKAAAATQTVELKVADSEVGKILVDQSGRTVYGFTEDKDGASSCTASCIAVWPALTSAKDVTVQKGIDKSLLTKVKRAEGAIQVSYKKWPLYYYAGDMVPGDVNGQGVDKEWFAVAPDGSLVK